MKKMLIRIISISLIILSVYIFTFIFEAESNLGENGYIILFTIVLIAGIVIWQFADENSYNTWVDTVKLISDTEGLTVETIFEAFKELDTVLGKPWLAEAALLSLKVKCLVFGPNIDGEFIYLYPVTSNSMSLNFSDDPSFIAPLDGEDWPLLEHEQTLQEPNDTDTIIRHRFSTAYIMSDLVGKIQYFRDTGEVDLKPVGVETEKDIYLFDEEFTWNGQDFYLYDSHMNMRMQITAPIPCKTFTITDLDNDAKIFKITKRIFHILPHYDMYEDGVKIGRIKKKLVLHHDHFIANTVYGKLELVKLNAMIGQNYQITIDKKPIGTIARNLDLKIDNVVFDNYVLTVNDPQFLSLITAMGVMVARETSRDRLMFWT